MSGTLMAKRHSASSTFAFPAPLTSPPVTSISNDGPSAGSTSRGRTRSSFPNATNSSSSAKRNNHHAPRMQKDIVVTPPRDEMHSSKIELISPRRGRKAALMSTSAHRRAVAVAESDSEGEPEKEGKPALPPQSPRRGKRDCVMTQSGHRRGARRDLDPEAIERAARKEPTTNDRQKEPTSSHSHGTNIKPRGGQRLPSSSAEAIKKDSSRSRRRRTPPNSGQGGGSRRPRMPSRSRSPHKAHVFGEYKDDESSSGEESSVDYEDDGSFAGDDDDDILGVTIDDDGDLEAYMDPEAREYRRRRGGSSDDDSSGSDSEGDSDENSSEEDEGKEEKKQAKKRRSSSIFGRFARSTSPSSRRKPTAGDLAKSPSKSPRGRLSSRTAKSLSPGVRKRVSAKRQDGGGSNFRSLLRRGSGNNADASNGNSGGNMMRRLSSFGNLKIALEGLGGSQHGPRSPHRLQRAAHLLRAKKEFDEDVLDNFDWDEDRQLSKEEMAYLEDMYKEIEELDI